MGYGKIKDKKKCSACLAGAVCGDHCSPISDTTVCPVQVPG
ncbi:Na+/H+ antiporter NhaC family protein [Butyrivibrio sp. WCE2006]